MDTTCTTCRFWEYLREGMGECHRHAPAPIQWAMTEKDNRDEHGDNFRVWPETFNNDWCGDHKPSPQALKAEFESERQAVAGEKDVEF